MTELVSVFFRKPDGAFVPGDIAGFPEPIAKRLMDAGRARRATAADHEAIAKKAAEAAKPPPLTSVRFLRSQPPYLKGEIAGFKTELAEAYVMGGAAEYTETPAEPQPPPAAPEPAPAASKVVDGPPKDKAVLSPEAKKALGRG